MKKIFFLVCLGVLITSCNKEEETIRSLTDITYKVVSDDNHPCSITTVLYEENNISKENIINVTELPFTKTYNEQIKYSANIVLKYKDNTDAVNFSQYNVVLQVFKELILIEEKNVAIIAFGKEVILSTSINN